MFDDVRVGFRVPHFVIHAVGDSRQPVAPRSHQPVETGALFSGLNFTRIARADGGQRVRRDDAGLQRRSRATQHKVAGGIRETQPPEILWVEGSLISQVMNGKNAASLSKKWIMAPAGAQL